MYLIYFITKPCMFSSSENNVFINSLCKMLVFHWFLRNEFNYVRRRQEAAVGPNWSTFL